MPVNAVIVLSIVLRGVGVGYSLLLLYRSGDRRFGFLTVMLALMAARQVLTVAGDAPTTGLEELPGLLVSVLAILTVYYLSSYVDEEQRVTEKLRRTNERLRSFRKAVEHAGHAIFLTEPDGTITYANPAVESVTGYDPEEVLGENPNLWKSGEHDDAFYAELWEEISAGNVWDGEIINERKSGDLCWVDMTIAPITDDAGAVERYVAVDTDVTARKERELRIEQQNERLELLNNTNEVLRDVNRELVQASTREEVERAVCERFVAAAPFDAAWVGDRNLVNGSIRPRTWAGVEEATLDTHVAAINASDAGETAVERALETSSAVFVDEVPGDGHGMDEAEAMAAIPLAYRGTRYGVLAVYVTDAAAFDAVDEDALAELGATVGYAINATESKQTLTADEVTELEFRLAGTDAPFVRLAAALDCDVELERATVAPDGEPVEYFSLTGIDTDAVLDYVADADHIAAAQHVCTHDDRCLFRFVVDDAAVVSTLAEYGAAVNSLTVTNGEGRLTAEVSQTADVRPVVEALQSVYPEGELVAQRERERAVETESEFRVALEESLTDRQLEAVRTAYFAGFFDWPRKTNGEEVAAFMDISQSTFLQHLRAAERKLLDALFDGDRVGRYRRRALQ